MTINELNDRIDRLDFPYDPEDYHTVELTDAKDEPFNTKRLSYNTLFKFIPVPFTGNRDELSSFIGACNRTFSLIPPEDGGTRAIVLQYIHTQIQGSAKTVISNRKFNTWEELKEFLRAMYADKKHFTQILKEMTTLQQFPNETVADYSCRIESCLKRAVKAAAQSCSKTDNLEGRIELLEEIASNRLIYY